MSKTTKKLILVLILVVSLVFAFGAGCTLGNKAPPGTNLGLGTIDEVWNIIFQDYVEPDKLDAKTLRQGAIEGMVTALDDPYTSYLDAEAYKMSRSSLEGKFDGIGAFVGVRDDKIMIIAPIPDSPADKAGIRAGDIVLEVDGVSTTGLSVEEVVLHIRGPRGTPVSLQVLHQDETTPEVIEIIRAEIELNSVLFEMKGDTAHINITNFSERTGDELSRALENAAQARATGIVLDLRSNPGGLLGTVVDVASQFLHKGVVVSVEDNHGNQDSLSVKPGFVITDLPMVVLTDNYSASGSEVLAGALQDYHRAIIAGTVTYGKGSVNTLRRLSDGSGLYITTARWLTPNGRRIEGKGITPDYELELKGEDALQWAIDYLASHR